MLKRPISPISATSPIKALSHIKGFSPIKAISPFYGCAQLPYRVKIETFVEPIRAFGVILFFFILGINLPLDDGAVILQVLCAVVLLVQALGCRMWGVGSGMSGLGFMV